MKNVKPNKTNWLLRNHAGNSEDASKEIKKMTSPSIAKNRVMEKSGTHDDLSNEKSIQHRKTENPDRLFEDLKSKSSSLSDDSSLRSSSSGNSDKTSEKLKNVHRGNRLPSVDKTENPDIKSRDWAVGYALKKKYLEDLK